VGCGHRSVECLNYYELFRKYRCPDCGGVFLCECETDLAHAHLPHQADTAHEFGTGARILVTGTAAVCARCRGEVDLPHPRAAAPGLKGKVERYYWHEIFIAYCQSVLDYYGYRFPFADIAEFEQTEPMLSNALNTAARQYWQRAHRHRAERLYDTKEQSGSEFLAGLAVPARRLTGEYTVALRGQARVGRWTNSSGKPVSVEEFVADWMRSHVGNAFACERRLITVLVAAFFGVPIQTDPAAQLVARRSTVGWSPDRTDTPEIAFRMPQDFGSRAYYHQAGDVLQTWIDGLKTADDPLVLYDRLLEESLPIRDCLWVADRDAADLGRKALQIIPRTDLCGMLAWTLADSWERQHGWPDLLIECDDGYLFSEVKAPNDRLSQAQMGWFRWALPAGIPCELVRVRAQIQREG
jgi:VRR-NUC domain-containing protein